MKTIEIKGRAMKILVVVIVAITMIGGGALVGISGNVHAATKSSKRPCNKKYVMPLYKKGTFAESFGTNQIQLKSGMKYKIRKCKSTDKKVAVVKKRSGDAYIILTKPGKATVTIVAKAKGSKKYKKYKTKITTYRFTDPIKSLKLGDEELAGKYKGDTRIWLKNRPAFHGTVSIVPAKGFSVRSIHWFDDNGNKQKDIKNGDAVSFTHGGLSIELYDQIHKSICYIDMCYNYDA